MASDWKNLPIIREGDKLLFQDTVSIPQAGTIVPCLLCADPFLMRQYVGVPDQICPKCWKEYDEAARVVCWKCKVRICRLVPKVLESGFHIRSRHVYHSTACNVCKPGLKTSSIIEIDEWMKNVREPKIIVPGR